MLPFSSIVSSQIRFLLQSLTDANFNSVFSELCQFANYGSDGSIIILRTCLDHTSFRGADTETIQLKPDFLTAIFRYLLNRPNFSTVLCEALKSTNISDGFPGDLCKELHLSVYEKIGVGLALSDSEDLNIRTIGQNFFIAQIEGIRENPSLIDSHEQIQKIVVFLSASEGLAKHVDHFMQMLSLLQPKHSSPFTLSPSSSDDPFEAYSLRHMDLFYDCIEDDFDAVLAEIEKEMSMADVMKDLGYGCTVNVSHCKEMLSHFLPLTEATLARILGTISRTNAGLEDGQNTFSTFCSSIGSNSLTELTCLSSWKVDVLVDSIKQIAPDTNWIRVMECLDHEGFYVPNVEAFYLIMVVYSNACQDPFPLHAICGSIWKNAEAQLSFLKYAVSERPEIFTSIHFTKQLAYLDVVDGQKLSHGHRSQAWLCHELLEVLCQLAERGHASSVRLILDYPLKCCPEVLLLGMAHINTAYNLIQYEVSSAVFPVIFKKASGSAVFHHLWHVNPSIVLQGFMDSHKTDSENMTIILGICDDLKILSSVLDRTPFRFNIKLAALASRKEQINLEKWLIDNLSAYGDTFFEYTGDLSESIRRELKLFTVANIEDATVKAIAIERKYLKIDKEDDKIKSGYKSSLKNEHKEEAKGAWSSSKEYHCNHCKTSEHIYDYCWKLHPKLRPKEEKSKKERYALAAEECINFLKEIPIGYAEDAPTSSLQYSGAVANAYSETSSIVFKVLEAHAGQNISPQLFEDMKRLHVVSNANSMLQNVGTTESSASDGQSEEIELEANTYFQKMFSGTFTTDAMVEMLTRFKDSPDKREKSIFECMIANLFDEYQFFPKYPETHLLIAAVLFGSLIKNQLVTHLALGIALRYVLDALRKSADSKMFAFGARALEQFVDRLEEWPQYCNHILQISHLRGTHSDLVAFTERALAKISSARSDLNGVNIMSSDQRQGSSMENMEVRFEFDVVNGTILASESSWKLLGSGTVQPGQQNSSPLAMQQRHQGFLDERHKIGANSVSYNKPPSSSSGQPSPAGMHDLLANSKPSTLTQSLQTVPSQNVATGPAATSTSPGFLRPSRGISSSSMMRQQSYSTGFGSALNIETLVAAAERRDAPIETPASEIQDKILFMINNISTSNVEAKAKEFTELLKEEHYPWFAQYMVMKRASIEPNFHDLYLRFLDKINSKTLNKEIVKATYENCKVLLRSELIKSSSEERSLLKNLGSWLGKFTIGRNQALRAREIDPKILIMEAYEKGLMIAVIPFTSKILEPCQCSLAYQPPNPWTMGILSLLAEIYALPNLKMNLKFDIEVLFKNLSVDMKEVKPTSLLKDRVREIDGNPDFSNKDVTGVTTQPTQVPSEVVKTGTISAVSQVELQQTEVANQSHPTVGYSNALPQFTPPHLGSGLMAEDEKIAKALSVPDRLPLGQVTPSQSSVSSSLLPGAIGNVGTQVVINPNLPVGMQSLFLRIVPAAMERAIKDIMPPVVSRSVTIACQTTKELVLKDFAMESDEGHIKNAAHKTVAGLAGSLAHVTCKEPLRGSISNHLTSMLQGSSIANDHLQQSVQIVTNDNLDLGCAVVEKAASDKAQQTIDGEISAQLTLRRKQREGFGATYFDSSTYIQGPMSVVPEALRPKPGRLSATQERVYEDFARVPWQNQSNQTSNVPSGPPASSGGSITSGLSRVYGATSGQLNAGIYSSAQGGQQTLDLISDEVDPGSAQLLSTSSLHVGASEGSEINGLVSSTVVAPELQLTGPPAKDSGTTAQSSPATSTTERLSEPLLSTGDALNKYQLLAHNLDNLLAKEARDAELQGVITEVSEIILRCISRDEAALAVAQKVFKSLYENASDSTHIRVHLAILSAIRDVCKLVVKELTSWVIYSDEDRKFNKDITIGLIHSNLLNLAEYNMHMAKLIDSGRNKAATEFSISLLQTLVAQEPGINVSELHNLVDALAKLATRPGSPESLQQLVEIARNPAANAAALSGFTISKDEKARQARDKKVPSARSMTGRDEYNNTESMTADPAGFREEVTSLFGEWYQICKPGTNDAAYTHFISGVQQSGLLKGDDMSDRFFRILTELSVSHCLSTETLPQNLLSLPPPQPVSQLSFVVVDAYSKLVNLIHKYCTIDQGSSKQSFLPKILSVTVRVIQKDAEEKKATFNPRPYFRLFINWLLDIVSPEPVLDSLNFQVHNLYKGTLRVLLVLLHDFPDFLCNYHFSFCDVIPPSCIQMRNVILSAFPPNMRLPDPSTPNLKIDLLPEISQPPSIFSDVDAALKTKQMKSEIDEYLKTRQQGSSFLPELKQRLLLPKSETAQAGTRYNVPLINSLVLYVGMQAIQQLQNKISPQMAHTGPMDIFQVGAAMDIFQTLVLDFDSEGRYLFLNAVANQLRYPNNHTHYFSFVLIYLFAEANQEIIQEQVTRVLLERLIVNRPHPWGLLITFIELIKNPRYNFWTRSFTRIAPEIEKLFDSVSRSCGGPKNADESMASGGLPDNTH
ncbi:hypothetical protein GIB67_001213 [Kingdonia uniflora]|uniref:CCR4-NOT transcription complex subunit 1 n=1 Tax=Kingdonia uniflora TaxID=39325 RepID=A0A7J7LG65_9MAGN|nr:hypothetical protein GIB67_001213 [Kingdonia uniflora]